MHSMLPVYVAACILVLYALQLRAADRVSPTALESGYRQMYNLDFEGAHQTFVTWEGSHPEDPMGPVSNAAAYLFAEFNRLHILESEFFTDDKRFEQRQKFQPDPTTRSAFESELAQGERLSDQILSHSPH